MTQTGSILGTRVLRTEDPAFLTRGAEYTDDLIDDALTGALRISFVRSPIAHAHISGIDLDEARQVPGFVAAYTAEDVALPAVAPPIPGIEAMSRPLLATGTVRYVGEPVVMVVADNSAHAEDAAELVDVDYDPLPVVVEPRAAARDENCLFEQAGTNIAARFGAQDVDEQLFDGCEVVVSRDIVNQRVAPAPMETRAAAATWGDDGRLTAWLSNQGAQGSQRALAQMLGMDRADVRVITPDVGGAFGAKFGADPEVALAAWAAKELGRPMRWSEARNDNLTSMTHGRGQEQTITIGGRADGTIEAYRLDIVQDCGAYPAIGAVLPSLTTMMAPGTYAIPRVEASARSVVTNTTPVAAYRGAGRPEAAAAIERAVDMFAAEIDMDPAEVRRRNLLPAFSEPHDNGFGAHYDSGDYAAALDTVLRAVGYDALRREQAERRARGDVRVLGIGLSCYVEITGGKQTGNPSENAHIEVHGDGTATILTGTSPHGQGHATAWAMLASAELGIPVEQITVRHGDTELVPQGGGTGGSRSLQQGGTAVRQASYDLIDVARKRAAEVLEANVDDLRIDVSRAAIAVDGAPHVAVSLADLAAEEVLFVRSEFTTPGATFPFGAHAAVVEVDTGTDQPELQRLVSVDDAGTILNPLLADGQRHGGLAQGATQALFEEMVYDEDGNPMTASFADYPFPSAAELPSFELETMETPTTYNSLGAKGIGEAGSIGATPAVQNAVIDAVSHLGVRHIDMPTTSYRIWQAIRERQG